MGVCIFRRGVHPPKVVCTFLMGVCTFLKRSGAYTFLKVRTSPTLAERVAVALVSRSHHVE
eukprot:6689545-Prymnesium_polylepis.1